MLQLVSLHDDAAMLKWDAFVESHPNGTPYHLSCWLRTIHNTYAFEPILYATKNTKGELTCIFPFFKIKSFISGSRMVSLPFSDYGGPLTTESSFEKESLDQIITEHSENVKYIEVRNILQGDCGLICHKYYKSHELSLKESLAEIEKRINKRTIRYSIRKAHKAGVEIVEENNSYGMKEFYRLNLMTRKKHGIPPQSKKFFDNILKNIIEKGYGFILLGVFENKVVAASLFLKSGQTIHYKYNASDLEYMKKVAPNHYLTWSAILKGIAEGYKAINFGRTSSDNKGLIRYKEMWGMTSKDFPYYYYPKVMGSGSIKESSIYYKIFSKIWSYIPNYISKLIGSKIHKYTA